MLNPIEWSSGPDGEIPFGTPFPFSVPFALASPESPGLYLEGVRRIKERGGRLVSLWGSWTSGADPAVLAAFSDAEGLLLYRFRLSADDRSFPSIAFLFPLANRLERAVRDLYGWDPAGLSDQRPWLDHGLWDGPPMVPQDASFQRSPEGADSPQEEYPFVRVEGEGVHEIPVGPIHAGIIEPGHFRFQVVGEKLLRMEERFGFAHKGVRTLFRNRSVSDAARLAGRVSGDSAVAFQTAFSDAVEVATGSPPPRRALWIRSILLERERIANHLGDLGALGNDAGFGFGSVQFGRLKEEFLRTNARIFGHRYLMDTVVPGGVAGDLGRQELALLREECARTKSDVLELKTIYDEHGGLQDRFSGTGWLDPMLAGRWGLGGVAGRASGQMYDLRHSHPVPPYDQVHVPVSISRLGDVSARVQVRFQEVRHSLSFLDSVLEALPEGPFFIQPEETFSPFEGVGWVEGWRGEVLCWVRLGSGGTVLDAHCHDPSWLLWPALEQTVPGNLVADFPLINKSFNLSYSGHDL